MAPLLRFEGKLQEWGCDYVVKPDFNVVRERKKFWVFNQNKTIGKEGRNVEDDE